MNGGATWSSWYNQPTAQLYHVDRRQHFSLSRLRRTAGERFGLHLQPRQRRRDHLSRLASGRRHRVRLRRARSARSRHHLWRRANRGFEVPLVAPARCRTSRPIPLRNGKYRANRTEPLMFSPVDPHMLYYAANVLFKTTDGGQYLADHQPRSDARKSRHSGERRARSSTKGADEAARRHLCARSVVQEHEHALGRNR